MIIPKKVRRIYCYSAYQGLDYYCIYACDEESSEEGDNIDTDGFLLPTEVVIRHDYIRSVPGRADAEEYISGLRKSYEAEGFEVKLTAAWSAPASGAFVAKLF